MRSVDHRRREEGTLGAGYGCAAVVIWHCGVLTGDDYTAATSFVVRILIFMSIASRCLAVATLLAVPALLIAESHNPADYPLRVHIFGRNQTTFYHYRQADEAKGEGRANLFENGEAKGMDFSFECDHRLQTSSGFETFPAK